MQCDITRREMIGRDPMKRIYTRSTADGYTVQPAASTGDVSTEGGAGQPRIPNPSPVAGHRNCREPTVTKVTLGAGLKADAAAVFVSESEKLYRFQAKLALR